MNTDRPRSAAPITVVIVDDQAMVRSGLRMILDSQHGIDVIGEAADGAAALEVVDKLDPDVVIMDIGMPVMDGIAATKRLVAGGSRSRVLVLTTYAVDENLYDALQAGAAGFFAKTDDPEHIIRAVRAATDVDRQLGPRVTDVLLERFLAAGSPRSAPHEPPELGRLTDREREVLVLIGRGRSNAEIATELVIGEATVKTHITRILWKLEFRDRVQAVIYCYSHGLVRVAP